MIYITYLANQLFQAGSLSLAASFMYVAVASTCRRILAEKELKLMETNTFINAAYYRHIQDLNETLRKRRHDYNNQMNLVISLVKQPEEGCRNETLDLIEEIKKGIKLKD